MIRRRLAIVATHPIQYQAPWFQALARRPEIELAVLFAALPDAREQGVGFGVPFAWDQPLLNGYDWRVLENSVHPPRLDGFFGSRVRGLSAALHAFAPAAVLITGWNQWPLLQALLACKAGGLPTIVRGESNALRPRSPLARLVHRALLSRYDAFLAIGTSNRSFYVRNGVPPERIVDAPYAVDNDRFQRQAAELRPVRESIRSALGIAADDFCFAFVGKVIAKKRPLDLVEAAARCPPGRPLHLLFAGDGALRSDVEQRTTALGLAATFTGFLNQGEIARAYVAADCLVLPSDSGETWGLVVNEGMACGLPAIVSDRVGCGPDLVIPGETGAIFPCGNLDDLARALAAVALHPQETARMGARAQAEVVRRCSLERTVDGTLEAVEIACARRAARPSPGWVHA